MKTHKNIKHGMTGTKVYRAWKSMMARCNNKNVNCYKNYGGRGISVSKRWSKFENFLIDMGEPPSDKHEIDRIDNDIGYSKNNCRWVTHKENSRNTSTARLNKQKAEQIKILYQYGISICDIARSFEVSWSAISHVVRERTWVG